MSIKKTAQPSSVILKFARLIFLCENVVLSFSNRYNLKRTALYIRKHNLVE